MVLEVEEVQQVLLVHLCPARFRRLRSKVYRSNATKWTIAVELIDTHSAPLSMQVFFTIF